MAHYIIFPRDTAGAMLHHSGEFESKEAALEDFSSIVGDIDPEQWSVADVTKDQCEEVEAWSEKGAPAWDAPEWLDEAIRRA